MALAQTNRHDHRCQLLPERLIAAQAKSLRRSGVELEDIG
jgi:hypothetical protein